MAKILIVDDDESQGKAYSSLLRACGHEVVVMRGAEEALDVLAAEKFDLIVTDYHMFAMDGLELVKRIRENPATATVPVLVQSGSDDPTLPERCHAAGALFRHKLDQDFIKTIEAVLKM
jgi:CheY-like chemotaxis protein